MRFAALATLALASANASMPPTLVDPNDTPMIKPATQSLVYEEEKYNEDFTQYENGVDNATDFDADKHTFVRAKLTDADFFDNGDWNPEGAKFTDVMHNWFDKSAMPFYNAYKGPVFEKAIKKLEEDKGALLATCPEGTKCRDTSKANLVKTLETEWLSVLKSFKTTIEATVETSKEQIETTYDEFVACEIDHRDSCCLTSEITVRNWYTQLEIYTRGINKRRVALKELKEQLLEIKNECPAEWTSFEAADAALAATD